MVQKHKVEPSGTTAIICHKPQNPFLSVIMYWYSLPSVSQVERDKKTPSECTFTVLLFPPSLVFTCIPEHIDPCQECNQQPAEETPAVSASSCSANSLHGSNSSNGSPVVNLRVSWKIRWSTKTYEVYYAPGLQIIFMLCCYAASIQITIKWTVAHP